MTSNNVFSDVEQNLSDYVRAENIAKNYQFFRIRYIKYKFIARYNTFQATTNEATAFPIPNMYHMIDKGGALPSNTSLVELKQMGAKPIRFTKNLTVTWKPGVSIATANADNTVLQATNYKISPWLMTNKTPNTANWVANDTDHKGLYWFAETAGLPGDGTYEYDAEVEVMFDFKRPLQIPNANNPPAIKVSTLRKGVSTPTGTIVPPA